MPPPSPPTIPSSPTTLPPNPPTSPSTPTPTPSPPPSSILRPIYATLLLTCPVILLLPPRKLDLYTLTLCGAWAVSAEELAFGRARARGEGEGKGRWFGGARGTMTRTPTTTTTTTQEAGEERDEDEKIIGGGEEEGEGEEKAGLSALVRALWMGDEKPGWQRRRLAREKAELERGRGYGEMIMEQVWEVFPGFGGGVGARGKGEGERGDGGKDGEEESGI